MHVHVQHELISFNEREKSLFVLEIGWINRESVIKHNKYRLCADWCQLQKEEISFNVNTLLQKEKQKKEYCIITLRMKRR